MFCLLALIAFPVASSAAPAPKAVDVGRVEPTDQVSVVLKLPLQHKAELDRLVRMQSDRKSPYFRRFLTSAQWNAYFAPSLPSESQAVAALTHAGFRVTKRYANRGVIDAVAPAATVEQTFRTVMHRVAQRSEIRYENATPLSVPVGFSYVSVSSASPAHPHWVVSATPACPQIAAACEAAPAPKPSSSPSSTAANVSHVTGPLYIKGIAYGPIAFADGYDMPVQHGYDGRGYSAYIVIDSDARQTDMWTYWDTTGTKRYGWFYRELLGPKNPGFTSGQIEAQLDAQAIGADALGANVVLGLIPDLSNQSIENGFEQIVDENRAAVVNASFGACEDEDAFLAQASNETAEEGAAKGITFVASTGDLGKSCFDTRVSVETPASDPYFTAVGGTDLFDNLDASYEGEYGWTGSGGGISSIFPRPWYQTAVDYKQTMRTIPDIAFDGDPGTGMAEYLNASWEAVGGTSLAAPINVARILETDEYIGGRLGADSPDLYLSLFDNGYVNFFHDITIGNNGYPTQLGYDLVTGIGSVDGWKLAQYEKE